MVLDFVLAHLSANVLEDEAGKVDFFTTQCGVRSELLPRSYAGRLMYFSDGFPILVSNTGTPRFTFFDEGQETATRFERYLKQYQQLFAALGEFELIFVADNENNSARAKAAFGRFLPADRMRGVTPMTPLGVDHFIRFLTVRQQSEVGGRGVLLSILQTLREGEGLYTSLEHQALYAAWKMGSTSAEKIRQRFLRPPCVSSSPPWFFRTAIRLTSSDPSPSRRKATRPPTRPVTRPSTARTSDNDPASYGNG